MRDLPVTMNEVLNLIACSNAQYLKCDVCDWDDQVSLFELALLNSPSKSIDIVIANAGLGGAGDPMMQIDGTYPLSPLSLLYSLKLPQTQLGPQRNRN